MVAVDGHVVEGLGRRLGAACQGTLTPALRLPLCGQTKGQAAPVKRSSRP